MAGWVKERAHSLSRTLLYVPSKNHVRDVLLVIEPVQQSLFQFDDSESEYYLSCFRLLYQ